MLYACLGTFRPFRAFFCLISAFCFICSSRLVFVLHSSQNFPDDVNFSPHDKLVQTLMSIFYNGLVSGIKFMLSTISPLEGLRTFTSIIFAFLPT